MTGAAESLGEYTGLKEEIIKKACALAFKAHKSQEKPYLLEKIKGEGAAFVVIAFGASWTVQDWFVTKPCGETKINDKLFPSLRSVGNDEAALVNDGFQKKFETLLNNSQLKAEVNKAIIDGKKIVFTGHSSGAAVAEFSTFWTLEEYLKPNMTQNHKPPFCVTFGSPLVGNHILSHATIRENWSRCFIHFVQRFDIVPRVLLAPFSAVEPIFGSILEFFEHKVRHTAAVPLPVTSSEFYSTVMRNAATVTSHAACNLMGSTNLLLETVTNFVELSPYRPFGTFVFCSGNGQLVVVRSSDAVLQLLFHTAGSSNLSEVPDVASKSIVQHLSYEAELQECLEMQNLVSLDQLDAIPLSADGSSSNISTALDGLGLNTRARLCIRAAGELQKQKLRNEEKIWKEVQEKALASMKNLLDYKIACESETQKGYYDAFKAQKDARDFQANVQRLVLAGVWDEIIEMLKRYELPDEFEGKSDWIKLGTDFRRLVEPLDIANYHRHLKNEDTGPYMIKARPKRYRYTQRWLEHAKRMLKGNISESNFWGEVEELSSWINNGKPFEDVKERVMQLEQDIRKWIDNNEITRDVFLKESTFVKWWKTLPEHHKATSCISGDIK